MSVTVPIRGGAATASGASRRLGRVARCTDVDGGTSVSVVHGDGSVLSIHLAEVVDEQAGQLVSAGFRRMSWASIQLHQDGPRASVHGVRHRLPTTSPAPVDAVLALARRGVPTVVVMA
jgi:hypothetical protein